MFCVYYQAHVVPRQTWFFVATLRAHEHLAFDRTFDKMQGIFEFFIPPEREHEFVRLMQMYEQRGIVSQVLKLPNRLAPHDATL